MKREKIAILPKLFDYGGDLNKKWYVYYSVIHPQKGKLVTQKIYKGLHTKKTHKERYLEAQDIINRYTLLIKAGYNPYTDDDNAIYADSLQYSAAAKVYTQQRKTNRSFNYFASIFIKKFDGLENTTAETYKSKLRTFNNWLTGQNINHIDVNEINNEVVLRFFEYLLHERQSSASTYNKYKNILITFFDFLIDQGAKTMNPVQRIPKCTRKNEQRISAINPAHIDQLVEALKEMPDLYLFTMFEYYCFMRPGREIRLMKISWIDWGTGVVRVPAEMTKTKKAKQPIIPDEFMKILMDEYQLHKCNRDFYVFGKEGKPGPQHLGKNTMRYRFMHIRRKLNLPEDYVLYSFKHTGNGRLEKIGVNSFDRMMQNGHTSITTTERYTKDKFGFESDHIRKHFPKM
jgi:integrase